MAAIRAGLTAQGLLTDPLAKLFVRPPIRMLSRVVRTPARSLPLLRELVSNVAGRTLLFDQQLRDALDGNIVQVVILGAGYDTRAYRFAAPGVRYIEVDSPATQAAKLRRLQQAGIDCSHVSMLPVDFATESLQQKLVNVLDEERPAFFVWEGVVEYLPEQAVRAMLRDLSRMSAPGSRIVFDIPHTPSRCSPLNNFFSRTLSGLLGEPKGLSLEAEDLRELLKDEGWTLETITELTELHERYFKTVVRRRPVQHNYYVLALVGIPPCGQ